MGRVRNLLIQSTFMFYKKKMRTITNFSSCQNQQRQTETYLQPNLKETKFPIYEHSFVFK